MSKTEVRQQKWAFIVGCNNSGTTLIHYLVSVHPHVGSMPREGQALTDQLVAPYFVSADPHVDVPDGAAGMVPGGRKPVDNVPTLRRRWAARHLEVFRMDEKSESDIDIALLKKQWMNAFNDNTRPVLLEKSPPNSVRTLWLQKHFQNAHFIGIVRNGYAVAESIRRRHDYPIAECAKHWATANRVMQEDFKRLKNAMTVTYETFTEKPVEIVKRIYQFLGLEPDLVDMDEVIHEKFPARQPKDLMGIVHNTEPHIKNMNNRYLKNLSKEDIETIRANARTQLDFFNYGPTV